jgi:predicted ATP-dependent serine protease
LGNRLQLSNQKTCQLYSGHRGAGKSTELLRLKHSLEKQTQSLGLSSNLHRSNLNGAF